MHSHVNNNRRGIIDRIKMFKFSWSISKNQSQYSPLRSVLYLSVTFLNPIRVGFPTYNGFHNQPFNFYFKTSFDFLCRLYRPMARCITVSKAHPAVWGPNSLIDLKRIRMVSICTVLTSFTSCQTHTTLQTNETSNDHDHR